MHKLNILVSKTDTLIGRGIRLVLGGDYNHCSICFDDNISVAYSFSRRVKQLWFTGCFVFETVDRYSSYEVFTIEITDEEFDSILEFLNSLSERLCIYNYIGAVAITAGVEVAFERSYICSTFVAKVLSMVGEVTLEKSVNLYSPMDIYRLLKDVS